MAERLNADKQVNEQASTSQAATPSKERTLKELVEQVVTKSADIEIWKQSGVDVSISCIERVQKTLLRAAELFRDGEKGQANQFFVHCVDGLERFLEAMTITRIALNLNFDLLHTDGRSLTLIEGDMGAILKAIVQHQEKQDYQGVADRLEDELLPNLHAWSRILRQLRLSQHSNA